MVDIKSKSTTQATAAKRTRARRSTTQRKVSKNKTDIDLVEQSFALLAQEGEAIARLFYQRLFEIYPEIKPMFVGVSIRGQEKKLLASLVLLVQNLRNPQVLNDYLRALGTRHLHYGAARKDYPKVTETLLSVLQEKAGDIWNEAVATAWRNTLDKVVNLMLETYEPAKASRPQRESTTPVAVKTAAPNKKEKVAADSGKTVMVTEQGSNIVFANPLARTLMKEYDSILKAIFPQFSVDTLVSSDSELFHEDPQHKSLADSPDKRAYTIDIQLGHSAFRFTVSPRWNAAGDYIGNILEGEDVAEKKLHNADICQQFEALNKVMGVISFDLDGTIIDVNDNFLSVFGYRRDEVIGQHQRILMPEKQAKTKVYKAFWQRLTQGKFDSGEYHHVAKDGSTIWLQASYNPVLGLDGKPYKIVKYATDITEQKGMELTIQHMLSATSEVMSAVAEGDLTRQLDGESQGDFASLQSAVNVTVDKISTMVGDIHKATTSISTATTEMSQDNLDFRQRTKEQARSLEETAVTLEVLTRTVRQNSDNALQANQLAKLAREQAKKGGTVIHKAIEAMVAISASSKKVADIISVIDEIAFQMNLLALNAAVEAARAGEQGRGFAVVASEVRNLAQRSAVATKEVKVLINDSNDKVKQGSVWVDESGYTLEDIAVGAKKTGDIIAEIAAAGIAQSTGIDQVNKAISEMDEMTQQNAALVEKATAVSESLDEQGIMLQQMMTFFNTKSEPKNLAITPSSSAKPQPSTSISPIRKLTPVSRIPPPTKDDEF